MDKMHDSGLTPVFCGGQPTFAEAALMLVCRKRCRSEIARSRRRIFCSRRFWIEPVNRDFHAMYIGEIVAAYKG